MHPPLLTPLALLALATVLLAACTSEANPTPTPTQIPEQTASPSPEPTTRAPFILQTPTPAPDLLHLAATVWLVDVRDDTQTTLGEFLGTAPYVAEFTPDGGIRIEYNAQGEVREITFDADGNRLGESPLPPRSQPRCVNDDAGARVDGRFYAETHCGSISPDGRLMAYGVTVDERSGGWDEWLLDLRTGETRLLQAGLQHCGGCDFRFGSAWSPDSRFLVVPDLVHQVFLVDLVAGTSIHIEASDRATQLSEAPAWSPTAARLLRPGPDGSTILEDPDAGTSRQLDDLPWPAAFDATGTYIYSPAWYTGPPEGSRAPQPPVQTMIADATTGEVIAYRAGAPPWERVWGEPSDPIVAVADGFVAALPNSEECDGTLVYNPGEDRGSCLEGAVAATFSPDTTLVALARQTGEVGPASVPGGEYSSLPVWEIAVFDRATGELTVVAEDAVSDQFPDLTWSNAGTHLLIRWPNAFGL